MLRISLVLFVASAMMVMMAVSRLSCNPGSENSCEASNPEFGNPPLRSEHSAIAGSKTIRCFGIDPKAPSWLDAPVGSAC